ncbi:MAG: DUF4396 domain-containing protein [Bacteroidales bacterium]
MLILNCLSVVSVVTALISAVIIFFDLGKRPQPMRVMCSVWLLTALWGGVFALAAYFWFGRAEPKHKMKMDMNGTMDSSMMDMGSNRTYQQRIVLSTLHCGAGCTLADIVGAILLYFIPVAVAGSVIYGGWLVDYILAFIFGAYFQYMAITQIQKISVSEAFKETIKVDFFSLTAWQIGMVAWMAIAYFEIYKHSGLSHLSWDFWFMMQMAMFCGFALAIPVNVLLEKTGVKRLMK